MEKSLIFWLMFGMIISVVAIIFTNNPIFYLILGYFIGFISVKIKKGDTNETI